MPPAVWSVDPGPLLNSLGDRSQDAVSSLLFAKWAVDELHYLADLDQRFFVGGWRDSRYSPDLIDIAHTRWATGSAMTALDLVAAAIGWLHLPRLPGGKVYDLHSFSRSGGRVAKPTCTGCTAWLTGALSGSGWLKAVRDDLVHQTVNRALAARAGENPDDIRPDRTKVLAHGNKRVDQVIRDCRTLAHREVSAFFQAISDGQI